MKKLIVVVLALLVLGLAACAQSQSEPQSGSPAPDTSNQTETSAEPQESTAPPNSETADSGDIQTQSGGTKMLIAYFSRTGNTETIATMVAEKTGATLFKIVPATPYPDDYNDCIQQARQEQNDNARPKISTHVDNMDEYDVIFLGYPNWWGTIPMPVYTFLEEYNLAGKTVIPFCTHEGSGLGSSERDIAAALPNATLLKGLAVRGGSVSGAESNVDEWIDSLY
jgi:flavodoxin